MKYLLPRMHTLYFCLALLSWTLALFVFFIAFEAAQGQDASTGAIRGTVVDSAGARVAGATVRVTSSTFGLQRELLTDEEGVFSAQLLSPGEYQVRVEAKGMAPEQLTRLQVDLGASLELWLKLHVAQASEAVTVSESPALVETRTSEISHVIDDRAIDGLPLNGRRYTDLALLAPGVTQDPRGLTSASNGDLAYGGIRGFQSSFLVDGADNNNSFFAQARGRYRAPYQFSNEVVQEFRVSSNAYGAELGRAGGAVVNVVTKSGSNHFHGKAFYFLRDSEFGATPAFLDFKPEDRQHQFGATLGGPIVKNRVFFFAGFDQHIFHVPTIVHFENGLPYVVPQPTDYESTDRDLVFLTAQSLSQMGGTFRSSLIGNAGFLKVDTAISPRHFLSARLSTSRYYGDNNVFFDPASPITNYAISENGQEDVRTESAVVSLTSGLTRRATSHLRVQFSRDLQSSDANSSYPLTQIYSIIQGFGRSNILPRETREHKWHVAETITLEGNRHSFKFGGDLAASYIYNFFPQQFGGDYIFDDISVDPWSFQPVRGGMPITPLRAYAHQVARYYYQDFGSAVAHPDTTEYAVFAQDSVRLFSRFALVFGVRYDLQRYRTDGLVSNPLWPDSGKVPNDTNNIAPRVGFAYSIGERRPLVIRGGYGLFYTRIPSIYTSAVETENGINNTHVYLRNTNFYDRLLFPTYPNPLVACPLHATSCAAPASVAGSLTSDVSAFAHDFQTPYVHQANVGLEREIVERLAVAVNYLYVRGEHLIRARDVNLPAPVQFTYPVFDETGQNFLGTYYTVDSFANWQMTPTLDCPYPPCVGDVVRPIPQLSSIKVFESAATSEYHGFTISARRRMSHGLYFRLAYTWARAMDNGQDALVAGRPATVQNSYAPNSEYGPSSTGQRQRLAISWIAEPHPFHREHNVLKTMFNDWKLSGVATYGSGRPFDARILGDANRDGNSDNDRLPGYRRNAFTGPDYSTIDARLARQFPIGDRWKLELLAESFNLLNRDNKRVDITDNGFSNTAAQFVTINKTVANRVYPAYYQRATSFLKPNNSYAPRQVQFAVRVIY